MDIATVVDSVEDLSPTAKILPKLQSLLRDPESGMEDIIALLKTDAPLTAQILRLSNSAAYRFASPCTDLEGAISCLGFQEVYRIVGIVATGQILGKPTPVYKLETGELWENALKTAVITDALAKGSKVDPNTAYTMGLVHSLGKVVINSYYMDKGIEIYCDVAQDFFIPDLEHRLIGFDHAQAGAALLRKWSFPEEFCIPIEHYPYPLKALSYGEQACLLHIATETAHALNEDMELVQLELNSAVLERANMPEATIRDALCQARESLLKVREFIAA